MSMQVDLSTELTKQERTYLANRGRYADIERADALFGADGDPLGEGDGTGPELIALGSAEQRAARRARLEAELAALQEADDADGDEEVGVDERPYSEWLVPELDKELNARQLSTSGTKPEKVKRLEEDDELNAE